MSDGIKITNSKNTTLRGNIIKVSGTAINIEDSENTDIDNNIILNIETQEIYGPEISDVFSVIGDRKDIELTEAFNTIQNSTPDGAVIELVCDN